LATVWPQPCVHATGLFGLCSQSLRWCGSKSSLTIVVQPWHWLSQLISSLQKMLHSRVVHKNSQIGPIRASVRNYIGNSLSKFD
jgi:hypothetical protein